MFRCIGGQLIALGRLLKKSAGRPDYDVRLFSGSGSRFGNGCEADSRRLQCRVGGVEGWGQVGCCLGAAAEPGREAAAAVGTGC